MANSNESIADVLAEMRADEIETEDGVIRLDGYADRIEAAAERERIELREDEAKMLLREYAAAPDESLTPSALELKRELLRLAPATGNAAAMREALEKALAYCESDQKSGIAYSDNDVLVPMLRAALAAPARNCDVGTAEEQAERFKQFCLDNHSAVHLCSRCPLGKQLGNDVDLCQLHWAQRPYASAEGGKE